MIDESPCEAMRSHETTWDDFDSNEYGRMVRTYMYFGTTTVFRTSFVVYYLLFFNSSPALPIRHFIVSLNSIISLVFLVITLAITRQGAAISKRVISWSLSSFYNLTPVLY